MESEVFKIRSSISSSLMRHVILRGSFLAGIGALLLLFTGSFMSPVSLSLWGLPVILASGGLMGWGLIPYRRLCRLEKKPNEIILNESSLHYFETGVHALTIPFASIECISFIEGKEYYGIGINLKHPTPEKVIVIDCNSCFNRYGCDLFLPYFTQRSCKELIEMMSSYQRPD